MRLQSGDDALALSGLVVDMVCVFPQLIRAAGQGVVPHACLCSSDDSSVQGLIFLLQNRSDKSSRGSRIPNSVGSKFGQRVICSAPPPRHIV